MEPTRCHFTAIFENVLKFFWQLWPAFILPVLTTGRFVNQAWIILLAVVACFLAALFIQFLAWRQTWLSAESGQLLIKSGLFWKKHQAIPFDKINTVDLSRNVFQRIVGTCRLKIDTGAVTGGPKRGAEVNLVFSLDKAIAIRSHVLALAAGVDSLQDDYVAVPEQKPPVIAASVPGAAPRAGDSAAVGYIRAEAAARPATKPGLAQPRAEIRARPVDFFLYGITQNKLLGGIVVIFSFLTFAGELIGEQAEAAAGSFLEELFQRVSGWNVFSIVLTAAVSLVLFYAAASLISILYALIRFHNFRASRAEDNIHIEYGLLTVKSYTIPVKNIHAVIVGQNLLRQWLGQCSVEIVSIGYGDEKNEVALLLPLIRLTAFETAIGKLLPEYEGQLELTPAPRAAFWRYQLLPQVLLLLSAFGFALIWPPVLYGLIAAVPLLFYNRYLNFHNAGINYSSERVEVRSGGFNRRRFRVLLPVVQSVGAYSHPLTERAGLRTYRIDYHAPSMRSTIMVRFLSDSHLDELRKLLDESDA